MKILLTGATGFIGSHIAKKLLQQGFNVYATVRTSSSFDKCAEFSDQIKWINTDNKDWKNRIKTIKPNLSLKIRCQIADDFLLAKPNSLGIHQTPIEMAKPRKFI